MALTQHHVIRNSRARRAQVLLQGRRSEFLLAALAGAAGVAALGALLTGTPALLSAGLAVALAVYTVAAGLAGWSFGRSYPHDRLGLCNIATIARLALATALIVPLVSGQGPGWGIFAVAVTALSLDGFDGWLARRQGLASGFGARFDMEEDSVLALVLALLAWSGGAAGWVVIVLGLPRYLFALAALALPWLRRPVPDVMSRKAVCVLQLGTLIALQAPFLPGTIGMALVVASAVALAWSFGRDVSWLWRARH